MRHGSLFSGIGGFDLAAEWMGWENVFHCEINKYCQKILKQNFPNTILYEDITKTDFSGWRGKVDIITGGFPCQPYSTAGKRKGKEDNRHLWPEMLRAIREVQPCWIVGENVPGLLNWRRGMVLAEIKADLEAAGFEVFPSLILPACGKNALHIRERLWISAYSASNRRERQGQTSANENGQTGSGKFRELEVRSEGFCIYGNVTDPPINGFEVGEEFSIRKEVQFTESINDRKAWPNWELEPGVCGVADGISNRVDRIKALGNAIVPQVAYEIFKAIELMIEKPE